MSFPRYPAYKDSGVEWLGEVPAHWGIGSLRRVIRKIEQGWSPIAINEPCTQGEGEWGVLKLSAVKQGEFLAGENKALPADIDAPAGLRLHEGDLLLTRANTPELVGDACVVRGIGDCPLIMSDLIYRLTLTRGMDSNYCCQFLTSRYGRAQIESDARGSSMSMAKISQTHIKGWMAPIPPRHEQLEIAAYITEETAKIDTLTTETQHAILLLKERRAALISAAVTGKIDVRGLVQQEAA